LEDLGIGKKIILKWILKRPFERAWTLLFWRRTGTQVVNKVINLRFS